MKDIIQKIKVPIILIAVLLAGFIAYNSLFKSASTPSLLSSSSSVPDVSGEDQTILPLLSQIQDINFDNSFFSNKAFNSLQNFNQSIVSEDKGRPNPFAPSFALSSSSTVESLGFQEVTASTTSDLNTNVSASAAAAKVVPKVKAKTQAPAKK